MSKTLCTKLFQNKKLNIFHAQVRNLRKGIKGPTYGLPPGEHPSFSQIVKGLNAVDQTIHYKVDIGLPPPTKTRWELVKSIPRTKPQYPDDELLDQMINEWANVEGPAHVQKIAQHYGVFQDLFGDAFFTPYTRLDIAYKLDDGYVPVYRGNLVKPYEAVDKPDVVFDAAPDTFYTLALNNPDGHLNQENSEYIHWLVGNIPDGDVSRGELIIDYMQPFPTRGTGYHRYVYVLYKQDKKLDFNDLKFNDSDGFDLEKRTFSTYNFYKLRQDDITPVGLVFFQADWDSSVTKFFHEKLDMEEPIFEYDAKSFQINRAKWFPERKPFNTYLDRYRDPKQVAKEFLLKRLKTLHPFKKPDPPSQYPAAHTLYDSVDKPSWLQVETKKERLGWGIVNEHKDMVDPE